MATIERKLTSSCLSNLVYDEDTKELTVTFTAENADYTYAGVPSETVKSLLAAPSVGAYFLKNIKGIYPLTD